MTKIAKRIIKAAKPKPLNEYVIAITGDINHFGITQASSLKKAESNVVARYKKFINSKEPIGVILSNFRQGNLLRDDKSKEYWKAKNYTEIE